MRRSLNKRHDHKDDLTHKRNDFNHLVPFEITQSSLFTTETLFPSSLPDQRTTQKRFSSGKLSSQLIILSVLKLDGSSFDIFVTKKATVAKVKQAVESAFSHLPKQGDCEISWSHVWSHFCLCFEHMKLLRDRDPITRFGIKNGDQIQFVRHTPSYILAGEASETFHCIPNESEASSTKSEMCGDMKNKQKLVRNKVNGGHKDIGAKKKSQSNWVKRFFSDRRHEGLAKGSDHAVNSTIRLGRSFSCDDSESNEREDISCRSSTLSSSTFDNYIGVFAYPTGYCIK